MNDPVIDPPVRKIRLRKRLLVEWSGIALLVSLVIALLGWYGWSERADMVLYDMAMQYAPAPAPEDIVIIAIDESSLESHTRWPWPRSSYTPMFDQLEKAGPRSVVFDILLVEPSEPAQDQTLAADLERMRSVAPMWLPVQFLIPGSNGALWDELDPEPPFAAAVTGTGHVNTMLDSDNVVRRTSLCFGGDRQQGSLEQPIRHLMLAAWQGARSGPAPDMIAGGKPSPAAKKQPGDTAGSGPSAAAGRDCHEPLMIPYSQPGSFTTISWDSFARGEVPADIVRDKYVLIGASAVGLRDHYPVPIAGGGTMAGVEINANIMAALMRDDFIVPANRYIALFFTFLPVWMLLLAVWRFKPRHVILLASGLNILVLAISVAGLYFRFWLPPVPALVGIALAYPLWGWRRLQATSDYMASELARMDTPYETLPVGDGEFAPVDLVTEQAEKLRHAIGQLRDLKRFVTETLTNLPDPMLVVGSHGKVQLSNNAARSMLRRDPDGEPLRQLLADFIRREDWSQVASALPGQLLSDSRPGCADKDHATRERDKNAALQNRIRASQDTAGDSQLLPRPLDDVRARLDRHLDIACAASGQDEEVASREYVTFSTRLDRSYAMRVTPLYSDSGILRGHICYLADISEIINAQREREEILQLLSHDMRAPQSAILALLEQHSGQIAKPESQRIAAHARHTLSLADNFVDLARMKSRPFTPEDVLLADLVTEASESIWPLAQKRGIRIEIDDRSDYAFVLAERESLFRALVNILDNGCKYSPEQGEIQVTLRLITLDREDYVRIDIADQGKGIDPEVIDNLFAKFVSKTGESASSVKGIGLGLHYVANVIDRHGGYISADNRDEGGAEFRILLPRANDDQLLPDDEDVT